MDTVDSDLEWAAIPARTLNIPATLTSGQAFCWRERPNGDWVGVVGRVGVLLRPRQHGFGWKTFPEPGRWDLIHRYFALGVDLDGLYEEWMRREPRAVHAVANYAGLRILRQDAEEAFFSFLCASCNTVTKITRTIQALAKRYGEPVDVWDGEVLHRFPTAERIADAREADLRSDLWGYRAPRLIEAARHAAAHGSGWLSSLRNWPYIEGRARIMQIFGIGPKIADCICLFGLWKDEAVPIDTHVRCIAVRLFQPELTVTTLTPGVYNSLADLFRDRFGPYAGWAQQYLFCEEKGT